MKRLTLEQKALRVIEWMVSDDLSETCEMNKYAGRPIMETDAKLLSDKVTQIYVFAHAVTPHSCYNVHTEWREKLLSVYNTLHRKREI